MELICDPQLAQGEWRRGRVLEVYLCGDGRIRTALVKTSDGEYKSPVKKLAVVNVTLVNLRNISILIHGEFCKILYTRKRRILSPV